MDYTKFTIRGKSEAELEAVELEQAKRDLKTAHTRNRLLLAWADMMDYAYTSMLTHEVNYQKLPEFTGKSPLLERAAHEEISIGESSLIEWMRRVKHGITAAIRRKGMKTI